MVTVWCIFWCIVGFVVGFLFFVFFAASRQDSHREDLEGIVHSLRVLCSDLEDDHINTSICKDALKVIVKAYETS